MIVALAITAAAANIGAAAPSPLYADSLENIFISACLDGSVKLGEQGAQVIQFDALPKNLKAKLGKPSKAQVWQLQSPGRSYLYMMEYDDKDLSPKVCGVASDQLKIVPAADAVAHRLNASQGLGPGAVTTEWHFPEEGYFALASRVHNYTVLQVNQMSDIQRKEALRSR
jgi:hypothetical protein